MDGSSSGAGDHSEDELAAARELAAMPPEERARFLGHVQLTAAAWRFITPVLQDGDLMTPWPMVDPLLRLSLAQRWLLDNARDVAAAAYDREEVVGQLAQEAPDSPLWTHFERVHVRSMRDVLPPFEHCGIGATTRLIAPGVEALLVHDMRMLPESVWQPGSVSYVYPLVMRWDGSTWLLLNFGADVTPQPGWPPTLT